MRLPERLCRRTSLQGPPRTTGRQCISRVVKTQMREVLEEETKAAESQSLHHRRLLLLHSQSLHLLLLHSQSLYHRRLLLLHSQSLRLLSLRSHPAARTHTSLEAAGVQPNDITYTSLNAHAKGGHF